MNQHKTLAVGWILVLVFSLAAGNAGAENFNKLARHSQNATWVFEGSKREIRNTAVGAVIVGAFFAYIPYRVNKTFGPDKGLPLGEMFRASGMGLLHGTAACYVGTKVDQAAGGGVAGIAAGAVVGGAAAAIGAGIASGVGSAWSNVRLFNRELARGSLFIDAKTGKITLSSHGPGPFRFVRYCDLARSEKFRFLLNYCWEDGSLRFRSAMGLAAPYALMTGGVLFTDYCVRKFFEPQK